MNGLQSSLLATLRFSGMRLTELATLRLDQVDFDARRMSIIGKGRKPRMIPIPPALAPVLGQYLDVVRSTLTTSPYLFVNPGSHEETQFYGWIGPRTIYQMVRTAGEEAGVSGRHLPHRWRHSYATSLLIFTWPNAFWAIPTSPPLLGTSTLTIRT